MALSLLLFFFFFSSRRRHTRYIGDWSSDVCSSDLPLQQRRLQRVGYEVLVASTAEEALQKSQRSEERRVGKECRSRCSLLSVKKIATFLIVFLGLQMFYCAHDLQLTRIFFGRTFCA